MEYKALYRKYRPSNFYDVIGQDSVTKTLLNSVKEKKVSHAYLLCGPRGTGKTSLAKLIAKAVNCLEPDNGEPCNNCEICNKINNNLTSDIIEIDAASNNGVDEIREIRNKVNYVSSDCAYKVYIVDEVHMLSTSAFNALLKTLEEPPKHIIFILATTEVQKVPTTVISRCQRFDLKKISQANIKSKLQNIVNMEKVIINDMALSEIARLSDGGLRDAIGLLDQIISYKGDNIEVEDVHFINGSLSIDEIFNLVSNMIKKDSKKVLRSIDYFDESGKDCEKLLEEIIEFLKNAILYSFAKDIFDGEDVKRFESILKLADINKLFKIIDVLNGGLSEMKTVDNIKLVFELTVLKIMSVDNLDVEDVEVEKEVEEVKRETPVEIKEEKLTISEQKSAEEPVIEKEVSSSSLDSTKKYNIAKIKEIRINNVLATAGKEKLEDVKSKWKGIRKYCVSSEFSNVAGLLMDAEIRAAGDNHIMLSYPYVSMVDNCNESLAAVEKLLYEVFNNNFKVLAVTHDEWNDIKKKYIVDKKNNIEYKIIEENEEDIMEEVIKTNKKDDTIDDVLELFGKNIVEIN